MKMYPSRRLLALALCLMLLCSMLSACGFGQSAETPASEVSVEASASEPAADVPEADAPEADAPVEAEQPADAEASDAAAADATEAPDAFQLPICEETETISYWFEMSPMVASYLNTLSDNITYQLLEELTNVLLDFWAVTDETYQKFNLIVAS